MKTLFIYFMIALFLLGLHLSCAFKQPLQIHLIPTPKTPEKPASLYQVEPTCLEKESTSCSLFPKCKKFCDDLFIDKKERRTCYTWPSHLIDGFEVVLDIMDKRSFENIKPRDLKCFLKLTKKDKRLFKSFTKEDAKEFLEYLVSDSILASQLASIDKGDFSFLNTLFRKISGRIVSAIKQDLSLRNSNFLIEIHQQDNKPALIWLTDYISYYCQRDDTCREPLDYYCEILKDKEPELLKDFFTNRKFEKNYTQAIQSKICGASFCQYGDLEDFNELCDNI